jgi:exonuclease III
VASDYTPEKIAAIKHLVKHCSIKIILLQETKLDGNDPEDQRILPTLLPNFQWFQNHYKKGLKGVAIGVRGIPPFTSPNPTADPNGTFLTITTQLGKDKLNLISTYIPPNTHEYPTARNQALTNLLSNLHNLKHPSLIGGDFNSIPGETTYNTIQDLCQSRNMVFLPNPYPSTCKSS